MTPIAKKPFRVGVLISGVIAALCVTLFIHSRISNPAPLVEQDAQQSAAQSSSPPSNPPPQGPPKPPVRSYSSDDKIDAAVGWRLRKYRGLHTRPDNAPTLDRKGKLTPEIIQKAHLSDDEVRQVQSVFDDHREKMMAMVRRNIRALPPEDGSDNPRFKLTAFPSEASDEFESMFGSIKTEIGEDKTSKVFSGYSIDTNYFFYGDQNAVFTIIPGDSSSDNPISREPVIESSFTDVLDKRKTGGARTAMSGFKDQYGDIFPESH